MRCLVILDFIWITNSKVVEQLQNLKFFHFGANRGLVALHGLYHIKRAPIYGTLEKICARVPWLEPSPTRYSRPTFVSSGSWHQTKAFNPCYVFPTAPSPLYTSPLSDTWITHLVLRGCANFPLPQVPVGRTHVWIWLARFLCPLSLFGNRGKMPSTIGVCMIGRGCPVSWKDLQSSYTNHYMWESWVCWDRRVLHWCYTLRHS